MTTTKSSKKKDRFPFSRIQQTCVDVNGMNEFVFFQRLHCRHCLSYFNHISHIFFLFFSLNNRQSLKQSTQSNAQLKYKLEKVTMAFIESSSSWPLDKRYKPIVRIKNNVDTHTLAYQSCPSLYVDIHMFHEFSFIVDHHNVDRITKSKQWSRFLFVLL